MKRLTTAKVTEAIRATMGNMTAAAQRCGVARQSLQEYIQRRPELVAVLQEMRESTLDHVESVIYMKAMEGQSWAVLGLLRCLGKSRGWVERTEVVQPETVKVRIVEEIIEASPPAPSPGAQLKPEDRK